VWAATAGKTPGLRPFLLGQQGQGLLIGEVSQSHSDTPHSVRLLWTSDQLDAVIYISQHKTQQADIYVVCPPLGFEPAILTGGQPQTHSLDPADIGIGRSKTYRRLTASVKAQRIKNFHKLQPPIHGITH